MDRLSTNMEANQIPFFDSFPAFSANGIELSSETISVTFLRTDCHNLHPVHRRNLPGNRKGLPNLNLFLDRPR